jgi:hypothetical protein
MSKDYPWGKGTPTWVRDATANDSDKSYTVPNGKYWVMKFCGAEILNTATVGNRSLCLQIFDASADCVYSSSATAAIAASQRGSLGVIFGDSNITPYTTARRFVSTSMPNVSLVEAAPPMVLEAGYSVRLRDIQSIDIAADDLTAILHYVEYDA